MIINGLIWDIWNIQHITRHHITTDDVEEVINNHYIALPGRYNRDVIVGETDAGRLLKIVLEERDNSFYYAISAFDAGTKDGSFYEQKKGGV